MSSNAKLNAVHDKIVSRPQVDTDLDKIFIDEVDKILVELDKGETNIDWSRLDGTLQIIDKRDDCADFRLQHLIRILYNHKDKIPQDVYNKIKKSILGFKYWMDEPGDDSMCYWSENHQILYATSEYLFGQMYPDEVFTNNGTTGKEHMEKARVRILDWIELKWNYGFIEYYSNVYYNEDIAPMANLIDFCEDDEIVKKMTIIMDLLIYDIASQSYDGAFVSASGRAYEKNRKGGATAYSKLVTEHLFGIKVNDDKLDKSNKDYSVGMGYCFTSCRNYTPPQVLIDIGLDRSEAIIKASNGLDIADLKREGLFGSNEKCIMMQWGMEAFSNPEVIRNTLSYMRRTGMFANKFLSAIGILNKKILGWLHLEPFIIRVLNPQTNGIAIQRGNTYTYKNKNYSMYTAQRYHPGDYGDQQHVQGVNISNAVSIFHCHPGAELGEKGANGISPTYWVSYGHLPDAVQHTNVQLAIYNLPRKKGMMEKVLLDYTHLYFPTEKFDEYLVDGIYAFARLGNAMIAVIANNCLRFRDDSKDDLIQESKKSYYITHMSDMREFKSLQKFMKYIKSNIVTYYELGNVLTYETSGKDGHKYELKSNKYFKVDDVEIDTKYRRYDSPYIKAEQKDKALTFKHNGKSLHLELDNMIREVKN